MTETTQIQVPAIVNEVRRLRKTLIEVEGKFREQRAVLARQGMSLPPGTLTNLQIARDGIDELMKELDDRHTELQQLRAVGRTTEVINSTLSLDEVLNDVMDSAISLTRAERGYLMLRRADTGEMEFRVARNIDQRTLSTDEFTVSRTVVEEVARTGQPVLTVNAGDDPRFAGQVSIVGYALRSILCVPLILKSRVTGVIFTDNRVKQGVFGEKELQLLQTFANQAAIAIENARLFGDLRRSLAQITGLRDLMSNVLASIASGVITTDMGDHITQFNGAAQRILDLPDGAVGSLLWQTLPLPLDEITSKVDLVRQSSVPETLELEHEFGQRGVANLNLKFSPLRDGTHDTQGLAIVVDDLTEIKQREAQLTAVRRYLTPSMVDNIESIDKLGLSGERRNVTVMYAVVREFQKFSTDLRPQEMMAMLNLYLTIAADSITQQNGIVDKYIANEVMGLFNTQLNPDEDHAWRAILAALDMADEFRKLHFAVGESSQDHFRIGIHTGDATLGNVGSENRREFTAIGDNINVGHRLLENARPGEVVISEDTARQYWTQLTDPASGIVMQPREELKVKGRANLVPVYRIYRPTRLDEINP
jgi:class 3 adenylate cyclase/GAF domain-containing protein